MSPIEVERGDQTRLRSARRWWRSVSRTLQPTAPVLVEHVNGRVAELSEAWDRKCAETSDLVTVFAGSLHADDLTGPSTEQFLRVAEKLRWRELRALLVSHMAAEIVDRAEEAARPLLDELERISLFEHRPALLAGDLAGFDATCSQWMPAAVIPAAYGALVRAIDEQRSTPVDTLLGELHLPPVDDELKSLLNGDRSAVVRRLEQAMAVRARSPERVVVDISSGEPVVELPKPEPVAVGEPPWTEAREG